VNRDPAELRADAFDFTGVNAGSNLDPEGTERAHDVDCALHGIERLLEGDQEAIAGGIDLASAVAPDLRADNRVVALHQSAPTRVADLGQPLGRLDDVGEQNRS
jgi:hypothetical protein